MEKVYAWPHLSTLKISGFTVPSHKEVLMCLDPYKDTLGELHIQNFKINNYNDTDASGTYRELLKWLRNDFSLIQFSMSNFFVDWEVGDGLDCGRWKLWVKYDGSL